MMKRFKAAAPARRLAVAATALAAVAVPLAVPAAGGAAPLPTLTLTLGSGTVAVSGSTVSGAVNVATTTAKNLKEPSPLLFALKPGVTPAEFEGFMKSKAFSDPNNADKYGTIVFDGEGRPGATTEAQTVLAPGTYMALNPEGEHPSNPPHTTFTVTASPAPASLAAPQAVERTIEFGFKGPSTLKVGQLVRFENEGFLVHMNIAFPVRSHKAALTLAHDMLLGKERAAFKLVSGNPVTFFGPLSTGAFQQETITAAPGWYVQVCFMDTQDGRQHNRLGMERVIHITK